ncbi:MAG: 1-acyl-sn-glycerol-3-phosphate acyltransferase [Bacteroidia bacterium]|nr:1-acyl-sn-glycerol-3-phosphate acyltransferase [Bacteroidia bacterium]
MKGPVIIAMNHPNAFMDPSALTYVAYPPRLKYLARGDAFKPGLISWLLEQIGIVPIFRIQDGGREGLKKNDEAYRRVNYLLKKNAKVMVFAEGLCIQERRLRPLKKGVARMVFGAYEYLGNDKLVVVPVGVNYSKADKFRSTLFYNIGEPIPVKDFIGAYQQNPAKGQNIFLQALEPKMKELITHIENKENDNVVYFYEDLCKKDLIRSKGLNYKNLSHDFDVLNEMTERVNATAKTNQALLDEFKEKASAYFSELREAGLRDWIINPNQNKYVSPFFLVLRYLLLLIGFPIYVLGMIGNFPPLIAAHKITKKIIKFKEFYASIALGLGIFLFLFNYLIWFFVVYAFSPNIFWPILVCLSLGLSGWFCLYYHPFALKTFGIARALKNKALAEQLSRKREFLLSLINRF